MSMRSYQTEALNLIRNNKSVRASIYAPTGAGKTVVFTEIIKDLFSEGNKKILIAHPRIALSLDQQKRMKKEFSVMFTSFHSGTVVQNGSRNNVSTTDRDVIVNLLSEEGNHIIYTSYDSMHKIADLTYDMIICDEAHYLTNKKFNQILYKITSKTLFFTATPINSDYGVSMDDVTLFGPTVASITPKDLIKDGYLVEPRLTFASVKTSGQQNNEFVDPVQTIAHVFNDQRSKLDSRLPHKMLVAMAATTQFEEIMRNLPDMRAIVGDVDLYFITANYQKKNGRVMPSRAHALEDFAANDKPCIIVHCDTLAEGIDIDGLTGVFIFRGLGMSKFIQTMGRCVRPYKGDLDKSGEPKKIDERIKTHAYVTVPLVDGQFYGNLDMEMVWNAFLSAGYGELTQYLSGMPDNYASIREGGDIDLIAGYAQILDIQFQERVRKGAEELDW